MGNQHISDNLKEAALCMKVHEYRDEEILGISRFSLSTLKRAVRWKRLMGSVTKVQAIGRGRPRKLIHPNCQYLLSLARHKPSFFLDEYARRLEDN
jgi:transposase